MDLKNNSIVETFTNDVSPKFVKVKASNIVDGKSKVDNAFIDIEWDIEHTEEMMTQINTHINSKNILSARHNFSKKFESVVGEIAEINSVVDVDDVIQLYVDAIVDVGESIKGTIVNMGKEYVSRAK
jgi:hypothetical protein